MIFHCVYIMHVYIYIYIYIHTCNYVCNMMAIYAYSHSQTNLVVARNFEGLQVLPRQSTSKHLLHQHLMLVQVVCRCVHCSFEYSASKWSLMCSIYWVILSVACVGCAIFQPMTMNLQNPSAEAKRTTWL